MKLKQDDKSDGVCCGVSVDTHRETQKLNARWNLEHRVNHSTH